MILCHSYRIYVCLNWVQAGVRWAGLTRLQFLTPVQGRFPWKEATHNLGKAAHSVYLLPRIGRHEGRVSSRPPHSAANCKARESMVRDGMNSCHTKWWTSSSFFRTKTCNDSSWAALLCCWAIIFAFLFLAKSAASCTISIDLLNRSETSRHVRISRLRCVIAHLFHDLYLSFSLPFPPPLPNFLTFFPISHAHNQRQDNQTRWYWYINGLAIRGGLRNYSTRCYLVPRTFEDQSPIVLSLNKAPHCIKQVTLGRSLPRSQCLLFPLELEVHPSQPLWTQWARLKDDDHATTTDKDGITI